MSRADEPLTSNPHGTMWLIVNKLCRPGASAEEIAAAEYLRSQFDALEAKDREIARLAALAEARHSECDVLREERNAAEAVAIYNRDKADRYKAALEKYGDHYSRYCEAIVSNDEAKCDCGFREALASSVDIDKYRENETGYNHAGTLPADGHSHAEVNATARMEAEVILAKRALATAVDALSTNARDAQPSEPLRTGQRVYEGKAARVGIVTRQGGAA